MWITGDSAGPDSMAELFTWLQDDEVSSESRIGVIRGDAEHEMAPGAFEWITALVSNGIALTNLLVAVAAWLNTRQAPTEVRIEYQETVVTLKGGSPEQVAELADLLERSQRSIDAGEPR